MHKNVPKISVKSRVYIKQEVCEIQTEYLKNYFSSDKIYTRNVCKKKFRCTFVKYIITIEL